MHKQQGTPDIKILSNEVFYPYKNVGDCFTMTKNEFDPISDKYTFAVHMTLIFHSGLDEIVSSGEGAKRIQRVVDTPLPNSYCDNLLRTHCVFCDEIHTVR